MRFLKEEKSLPDGCGAGKLHGFRPIGNLKN